MPRPGHRPKTISAITTCVRVFATGTLLLAMTGPLAFTGCAISTSLTGTGGAPADGSTTGDPQTPGGTPPALSVTIQASNTTPQLNEEVILSCVTSGSMDQGSSFSFQSADVDLQVDRIGGTATFIVTDFELDLTIDIRCTATDANGNSATSPRITIFPTR